ncbi:EscU/YscU/HrcU family type III secretion system export apparatus switch protein [Chitinimonas arctica]|uniref:EscU/YscU/HrcU family type III secretion system export apparatus switch protein n=1 Tax=Chitinimonas arctica TaxID=2594795 RepID=A0A516S9P2_9NEIS|nr:EscU/YscU/HrcU family type III secretion system export apparatus switch protein [Chitinimonas arctica]QDQ24864.1 EscU/YscU/HrcU family type III secretion system export apparatus switch protein [Chitinimonas arctica]
MSEKNEKPTPKRIRDARQKGQVIKSAEIASGVQLGLLLLYLNFQGGPLLDALKTLVMLTVDVSNQQLDYAVNQILIAFLEVMIRFMGLMALMVVAGTVFALMAQVGPLLAWEAVKPSAKKINPLSNLKQMFSLKTLFDFAKSLFKVTVLGLIFTYLLKQYMPTFQFLPLCGLECGLALTTRVIFWMWSALTAFYVVIGIADYAFQYRSTMKQLMMSMEEIKQEYKDSEGNPEIKGKRRETHREVQSGSLAMNVKKSSVLVRNPTHIAICLYFKPGETDLPLVLEKGTGLLAIHMVKLAERANVPVVENIAVARALLANTEAGDFIPSELFEPVAHILRTVMNLNYEQD